MIIHSLGSIDGKILIWIQDNLRNSFMTPFFKFITSLGNHGFIWIVFAIILIIPKKTRWVGITVATALLCSYIVNNLLIKNIVARIRPYEVVDGLRLIIEKQKDFSFPSGHTASSFAAAVVMFKQLPKKIGIPAIILAALIAFSRLYVGVHYPTDVLFGLVSGVLMALIGMLIINKIKEVKYS